MSITVKYQKLSPEAKTPSYAKFGDAGLDLVATTKEYVNEISEDCLEGKCFIKYGTGIALEIPAGYVGLIFPRSSLSNKALMLTNHVGVVDSGYRGEITFRFKKTLDGVGEYEVGDRIGQLIVMPYPEVQLTETESLSESQRGNSGFGSSGK